MNDTYLIAIYPSSASFREKIVQRAHLDLLATPSVMLFPESSIEDTIENARQLIRSLPEELVSKRIRHYESTLTRNLYTYDDLLSTSKIQSLVGALEVAYLKLIGVGFVHESSCLYSMSAPASAFRKAIDKPKEVDLAWQLRFCEIDLRIYGARCLHLFWCADWLLDYLNAPKEGPFMLCSFSDAGVIARMKAKVGVIAEHYCETGSHGAYSWMV